MTTNVGICHLFIGVDSHSPSSLALDTVFDRGGLYFFLIKGVIERVGGSRQALIAHKGCFVLFLAYLCMRLAMMLAVLSMDF